MARALCVAVSRSTIWLGLSFLISCLFAFSGAGKSKAADDGMADIGFVGLHGGVFSELEKHAQPLHLKVKYFDDAKIANRNCDLASVDVIFLQHIREEDRDAYRELLTKAQKTKPSLKVIPFQENAAVFLKQLDPTLKIEDGSGPVSILRIYFGESA